MKRVLEHLEFLVGLDSRNPPREIDAAFFEPIRTRLGADFHIDVTDHGDGSVSMLAVRGAPKRLFNVHLDTVPDAPGYTADPHVLRVEGGRAIGLGACDIKGAAAGLLAAAEVTGGPVALLFTTDEEAGSSTCVRSFCGLDHGFTEVVVGEPTHCEAILEHRGIQTATVTFLGVPGHASSGRADEDSAVHRAVRWASDAMILAKKYDDRRYKNTSGIRFNLGRIDGGVKPNMIAGSCSIRFGFRPLPGMRSDHVLSELWGDAANGSLERGFTAPSLPPGPDVAAALDLAAALGVSVGAPVDFWTEAALFCEAGLDALVFGPGDIAQAHTADEWVSLDQLNQAFQAYCRWLTD